MASPQLSHSATLSTSRHSVRTLTRASATLKRIENRTQDTLLTSFRVLRPWRATCVEHVSLNHLPQSSSSPHLTNPRLVLPNFHLKAFDISFPTVETTRISPRASRIRVTRFQPSVQSFCASFKDFLTSHLHSNESNRCS